MYNYSLRKILSDVLEGQPLSPEQYEVLRAKVDRDTEEALRRAEVRRIRNQAFDDEIMAILEAHPGRGFTATDIQFLIPDFVNRHITNQRVSRRLRELVCDPDTGECRVFKQKVKEFGRQTVLFYVGDKLVDGYRVKFYDIIPW